MSREYFRGNLELAYLHKNAPTPLPPRLFIVTTFFYLPPLFRLEFVFCRGTTSPCAELLSAFAGGRTLSKVTVNPPCARDGYRSDCVVQKDRHACTAATQNGPVCELCTRTRPGQVARQAPFHTRSNGSREDRTYLLESVPTRSAVAWMCSDCHARRPHPWELCGESICGSRVGPAASAKGQYHGYGVYACCSP